MCSLYDFKGVYLSIFHSCHIGFERASLGRDLLQCRFMKGVKCLKVLKQLILSWDMAMVLNALIRAPFEPIESVQIKLLSLKMAILLILVSAAA